MTPIGSGGEFVGAPAAPSTTPANVPQQRAQTPAAGFALQNASNVPILTWTAPNDGQMHQITLAMQIVAGGAGGTGGAIVLIATQDGSQSFTSLQGGNMTANQVVNLNANFVSVLVDPGTTVTLEQQTALTAGAVKVFASMIGV